MESSSETLKTDPNHLAAPGSTTQPCPIYSESEKLQPVKAEDLEWDGEDDVDNPRNWPMWERFYGTFVPAFGCFAVSFGTSVFASGAFQIAEEFNISLTKALAGVSLYVLGMALGPMIAAPISETMGRRACYLVPLPISALFVVGAATSKTFSGVLACRFFSAMFASCVLSVGAGTCADIWDIRGPAGASPASLFLVMAFMGPTIGPLAGFHLMADGHKWNWTMWLLLILFAFLIIFVLFARETYKKTILIKRAKHRGIELAPKPPAGESLKLLFTVVLFRPFAMLIFDPTVSFCSLYNGFCFAVLFASFEALPYTMETVYMFTGPKVGNSFLSIAIGVVIAAAMCAAFEILHFQPRRILAEKEGKKIEPELRLVAALIGSVLFPTGLFIFGWTARPGIHYLVPLFGGVIYGWGIVSVFISTVVYIVSIYDALQAASALAANGMVRYIMGAAFPLFTVQMYQRLGVHWATSLLGFFALALLPWTFVLFKFGKTFRQRSRYASKSG